MQISYFADEIRALVQPKKEQGQTAATIRGIASLDAAQPGDLSFLGNAKYKAQVATTRASLVLLPMDFEGTPAPDQVFFWVDNPSAALARICKTIEQSLWPKPQSGVHPSAQIAPGAQVAATATVGPLCVVEEGAEIGEGVYLQSGVFIGRNAKIGAGSWLMPGAIVATGCVLGQPVRLQPGAVIGSDGFGYEFVNGRHEKVPQVGIVILGDDVEIGANTTLDRARFSCTRVGTGTKIDNLVQVGHNVVIGKHCIVCAQVGISGSSTLEDYVVLGGQAGLSGHITLRAGSQIGGQAGEPQSLPPKSLVTRNAPLALGTELRLQLLRQRLPELFKRVSALEAQLGATK